MQQANDVQQNSQVDTLSVSLIYFVTAWFSLKYATNELGISFVWLANGVLLAYLVTTHHALWSRLVTGCILAGIIASLAHGADLAKAMTLAACNLAEVIIPAHILGGRLRGRNTAVTWAFAQKFLMYGVILGPLFAAALAGVALSAFQSANSSEVFRTWFMADALGIALVTPLAVALRKTGLGAIRNKEGLAYMMLCLGLVAMVTTVVFSQSSYPLLFVIMPFLVFAAFRLGLAGLCAACALCGSIALVLTSIGTGPIYLIDGVTDPDRLLLVQLFILFIEVSTVPVALALDSRLKLESQLATANARLEHLAGTDALTGLANRRAFDRAFEREWAIAARAKSSVAIAIVDVDHFKSFNDTYGHIAGDECLTRLGSILSQTIFRPGDFVGRYGGEEFVIILPDTDTTGAERVCNRIRQIVSAANLPHEASPMDHVTVSVGFASMTAAHGLTRDQLLKAADSALYKAKSSGRNRVAHADSDVEVEARELKIPALSLVPALRASH